MQNLQNNEVQARSLSKAMSPDKESSKFIVKEKEIKELKLLKFNSWIFPCVIKEKFSLPSTRKEGTDCTDPELLLSLASREGADTI